MITIYGKQNCSYCDGAKMLLNIYNIDYIYKELGKDFTKEDLLRLNPDAKTFPQIFDGDQLIGGYTELCDKLQDKINQTNRKLEL